MPRASAAPPPHLIAHIWPVRSGFAKSVDPGAADVAVWTAENASQLGRALQSALKQHTTTAVVAISTVLSATTRFTVQGVVSLVLSFVIVWDLPLITRGIDSLKSSRLGFIYNEVAPPMAAFGALFGKALQAQASVAVVNTVLTSLGMVVLQIPGVGFLSLIVFFCSFIPVAGVVLSTVPIGFVALTEYGIARFFACIGMVLIAHAVEAYLLNPAIYSVRLFSSDLLWLQGVPTPYCVHESGWSRLEIISASALRCAKIWARLCPVVMPDVR